MLPFLSPLLLHEQNKYSILNPTPFKIIHSQSASQEPTSSRIKPPLITRQPQFRWRMIQLHKLHTRISPNPINQLIIDASRGVNDAIRIQSVEDEHDVRREICFCDRGMLRDGMAWEEVNRVVSRYDVLSASGVA